jgi:arabinose-5-phosphate isomerase
MLPNDLIKHAQNTILMESDALVTMAHSLNASFLEVVELILNGNNRLIVTGIGKSGIIAQKWVATFNSTGQPAIFMHAADAIHGDLGMIQHGDVVVCISKSGESPEIRFLVPLIQRMGNKLISVSANVEGFLSQSSDYQLHTPMDKEACPNNLAPTTSTTLQLAMGDALAVALMQARSFTSSDFAKYHPGGALGKKLLLKSKDVMIEGAQLSVVSDTPVLEVISAVTKGRVGCVAVVSDESKILGVITDGDIRRMLSSHVNFQNLLAHEIMTIDPKVVHESTLAAEAFRCMENNKITQLLLVDDESKFTGIVHLHDIIREGIF